jgi:hypothetical protein
MVYSVHRCYIVPKIPGARPWGSVFEASTGCSETPQTNLSPTSRTYAADQYFPMLRKSTRSLGVLLAVNRTIHVTTFF